MKTFFLRSQFNLLRCTTFTDSTSNPPFLAPIKTTSYPKHIKDLPTSVPLSKNTTIRRQNLVFPAKSNHISKPLVLELVPKCQTPLKEDPLEVYSNGHSRFVILGAVSLGLMLFLMGMDDQKAMALGPEGPLVEEFWENVRRYGLYALTVSTGAIYTIFQPIFELLKNPISAILILTVFGGAIYIVSQVLSAMVGVSDFTYDYGY